MRSYFVRHTERLLVNDDDLRKLWHEDRVAIHYPEEQSKLKEEDNRSLHPADYGGRGKTAVSRLAELAASGGYVWAESFVSDDKAAKVGFVKPGTEVVLRDARWKLRGQDVSGRSDGDPAVLKSVKLTRVRSVPRRKQIGLRDGRPQQGTISYWHVGDRLADFVEGRPSAQVWPNLSVAQQEAVCAEYLRDTHQARPDLPRLHRLLLPVGRTLQDVDIYGYADDGREIFGQVTYHSWNKAPAIKKRALLRPYGEHGAHLLFFCPGHGSEEEGMHFVSADKRSGQVPTFL